MPKGRREERPPRRHGTGTSGPTVPPGLVRLHRWLGLVLSLFFAMWFASGFIMMFVPYPALLPLDRYRGADVIDMARVQITPSDALERSGWPPDRLQGLELRQRLSGPMYILRATNRETCLIDASDGRPRAPLSAHEAIERAERFAKSPVHARYGPWTDDQWTVAQGLDAYRPLFRLDMADGAATALYVSSLTGDVVQKVTRTQRIANYAGSVAHWIYPTVLRRYPLLWSNTIWLLSALGIVLALSGLVLGLLRMALAWRRSRGTRLSPFRRIYRWHHLLGLGGGGFCLLWILSGWLSVDHGLIFPDGQPDSEERRLFAGQPLGQGIRGLTLPALRHVVGQSMLTLTMVDGRLFLYGVNAEGRDSTWDINGVRLAGIPEASLLDGVLSAWPRVHQARLERIGDHDLYGRLVYQPLPLSAVRIRLGPHGRTWVDVDPASGALIDVVDWRRRLYRWLFNGLHTFDVPVLNAHPNVRRGVMAPLLITGFLLSGTGFVMGMRRLVR